MIGYVTLGTNDLAAGALLYDAIAAKMGTGRVMKDQAIYCLGHAGGGGAAGYRPDATIRQARGHGRQWHHR